MDLYFPAPSDKPMPVAVNAHGGSWSGGDKSSSEGAPDIPELVARGYLVVTINYRLAPKYKFPAQIEDVKCAIRHLRANAATYHLDPNRIGAWGCSAGGHLVSLLALTDKRTDFDGTGGYVEQSSRVQATVPMSAPADLTLYDITERADMLSRVFGVTTSSDPRLVRASPITYVTKAAPPFLIFAAENDTIIPPVQGQVLYDRLKAAGVPATLVIAKNAHHCFPSSPTPISPTREEISKMIADFFDRAMRP
jgi:acetyl esterase/lipase